MKILAIETSCDDTAAAVVENGAVLLSSVVASSEATHRETKGVVPEVAAREQLRCIIPVIKLALAKASLEGEDLDALAVTIGPGLVGSLLVGVETARTLAFVWKKPLVPINHLLAHLYANFITGGFSSFPAVGLIASGGHTELVLLRNHKERLYLGGTLDDAAGEAFDKVARLLGLDYPGGPEIEKKARDGDPKAFNFPRPLIDRRNFDFSFSGLKAAVFREVGKFSTASPTSGAGDSQFPVSDLAASFQQAVIDVLLTKTFRAVREFGVRSVLLGGGVVANKALRGAFLAYASGLRVEVFIPEGKLCTDNAVGVAAAAFYNFKPRPWREITADSNLAWA